MRILVTGGCGFIGSGFLRYALAQDGVERVVNLDALTYSGRLENVAELEGDAHFRNVVGDITDADLVSKLMQEEDPTHVVHFAAESHVDRSLFAARCFVSTNIDGTLCLLEATRARQEATGKELRFLQISTDEVYGDLETEEDFFVETMPLDPRNPYSATKAGADLLALAFARTHELWLVVTRSSNNYGPRQFPEKLIPLMITNALEGKQLPVYGDGKNVRDWLWVDDNCAGVWAALTRGKPGEAYNLGGASERQNLDVVKGILAALDKPESMITYVKDRPGHDRRYAIDFSKAERELGFRPKMTFEQGLERTVAWYRDHSDWWRKLKGASFQDYYREHYGKLGLKSEG
ncbi:MAG: dTDP-glucose 4,6-dehydratase [Planctomycetes bacterium]|nr:dTDP-glucose 4,6-dehydratase [Planctomycetota bacterium]